LGKVSILIVLSFTHSFIENQYVPIPRQILCICQCYNDSLEVSETRMLKCVCLNHLLCRCWLTVAMLHIWVQFTWINVTLLGILYTEEFWYKAVGVN